MKLVATPQLAEIGAFVEASYASPSSQRESSLLSSFLHVAHVLHSSTMREGVEKLVATVAFHLQLQKLGCRGIFRWCWTSQDANWPLISEF